MIILKIQLCFKLIFLQQRVHLNFFKVGWMHGKWYCQVSMAKICLLVFTSQTSVCNLPDFSSKKCIMKKSMLSNIIPIGAFLYAVVDVREHNIYKFMIVVKKHLERNSWWDP